MFDTMRQGLWVRTCVLGLIVYFVSCRSLYFDPWLLLNTKSGTNWEIASLKEWPQGEYTLIIVIHLTYITSQWKMNQSFNCTGFFSSNHCVDPPPSQEALHMYCRILML